MNSGLIEDIEERIDGVGDERIAVCTVRRKGFKERSSTFSVHDAKVAGLWDERETSRRKMKYDGWFSGKQVKAGEWAELPNDAPWHRYPERMLTMRARGYALRDNFADALGGLYLREEFTGTTIEGELAPPPRMSPSAPVGEPPVPPPPPDMPEVRSAGENADLAIGAYEEAVQGAQSESELDQLWQAHVQPVIEAGQMDDLTLARLQGLDDERRGAILTS
jgi:hypothetical protein